MKQPNRRAEHRRVFRLKHTGTRGFLQHARRRGIEDFRHIGGVNELQILGNELDIHQRAGGIFEIPRIRIALFLGDRRSHLDDIGGD